MTKPAGNRFMARPPHSAAVQSADKYFDTPESRHERRCVDRRVRHLGNAIEANNSARNRTIAQPQVELSAHWPNPTMELHSSTGALIASNDNWQQSTQVAEIRSTSLPPGEPLESAIVATLAPGSYTAIVRGVNSTTGIAMIEGYELGATGARLVNISTRGRVGFGNDVLIGGFVIQGTSAKRVLMRAVGPSLATAGVRNVLANPFLELHNSSGALLNSNDNWNSNQFAAQISATGLAPSNTQESAIIATLAPGNYTAIMRGVNNTTGVGLVELYDLDN